MPPPELCPPCFLLDSQEGWCKCLPRPAPAIFSLLPLTPSVSFGFSCLPRLAASWHRVTSAAAPRIASSPSQSPGASQSALPSQTLGTIRLPLPARSASEASEKQDSGWKWPRIAPECCCPLEASPSNKVRWRSWGRIPLSEGHQPRPKPASSRQCQSHSSLDGVCTCGESH